MTSLINVGNNFVFGDKIMKISKSEEKILSVMSYSTPRQRSTIALYSGMSRTRVYEVLVSLEDKKIVKRESQKFGFIGRPKVFWKRI
jgi:sugar-specific transcriptional regulator TrmB